MAKWLGLRRPNYTALLYAEARMAVNNPPKTPRSTDVLYGYIRGK